MNTSLDAASCLDCLVKELTQLLIELTVFEAGDQETSQIIGQVRLLECLTEISCQDVTNLAEGQPKGFNELAFISTLLLNRI